MGHIKGFCKKLVLFRASLQRNDTTHFSSCSELLGEGKSIDYSPVFEKISKISDKFNDRFAYFDLLKKKVKLFNNPTEVNVESQPLYLQQELCELQCSRKNERYNTFWKLVSKEQFPFKRL